MLRCARLAGGSYAYLRDADSEAPDQRAVGRSRVGATKRAEAGAEPDQLIYVRIADTLRESILSGRLPPGHRLPSEAELGRQFRASRTSIREALRVLVSQRLIDTSRGATGGSTVRQLDHLEVIDMLKDNIRSLMIGRGSTHDEMEEVRELLEVSATWVAAQRRTEEQLARIASCIAPVGLSLPTHEQTQLNLRFHYEILQATGNRLLHLFAEPILVSINLVAQQQQHDLAYYRMVAREHQKILIAIRDQNQSAARDAMSEHVLHLRSKPSAGPGSPFTGLCFGLPPAR
jgi:GntR family transcriptional repressor for pyruvate dehydrogenase complex